MTAAALVEGWIVAGGQSRRMGRDKAALTFGGESLLGRTLEKLRSLGLQTRIAGLRTPVGTHGAMVAPDAYPGRGPLAGMETALRESAADSVLVLAVDLPLISTAFLRLLLDRTARTGAMACVPRVGGAPQPLCAVYHRRLHAAVVAALEAEQFKVMTVVASAARAMGGERALDVFDAETAWTAAFLCAEEPLAHQFLNCNTPDDLCLAAGREDRTMRL